MLFTGILSTALRFGEVSITESIESFDSRVPIINRLVDLLLLLFPSLFNLSNFIPLVLYFSEVS
jgi:hypothetical protein